MGFTDTSNFPITNLTRGQHVTAYLSRRELVWPNLDFSLSLRGTRLTSEFIKQDVTTNSFSSYNFSGRSQLLLSALEKKNITTLAYDAALSRTYDFFFDPTYISNGVVLNNDTFFLKRKLLISLGGRFDNITSTESYFGDTIYRTFSYRAAGIWRFNENHAVRITGSSAFRPPSAYETFQNVQPSADVAPLPDGYPPIRYVMGNPQLEPEKLQNIELGYLGRWFQKFQADLSIYGQDVWNLTGNQDRNGLPGRKINRFDYRQLGVEMGLRFRPSATMSTYLNYSFVYSIDKDTQHRIKEFPTHIGGWGGEVEFTQLTRFNIDTYWVFDYEPHVTETISNSALPLSRHEKRHAAEQVILNLRIGRMIFDNQLELYLMGKNLISPFRQPSENRMYPICSVQPIGAEILLGLNLSTQ